MQPLFAGLASDADDSDESTRRNAARVALPVPVDELFDYSVPEALREHARPGCRVQVRFRDRHLTGIIVERGGGDEYRGRLRPVEAVIDPEPVLSTAMISILREAAHDVLCPIGVALATALPSGSAPRMVPGFAITRRGREALRVGALRGPHLRILEALSDHPQTGSSLRGRATPVGLADLERDGLVVRTAVERAASARERTVRMLAVSDGVDAERAASQDLSRAPRQAELLRRLARDGAAPAAAISEEFSSALVRALVARGLVAISDRPKPRDILGAPLPREPELLPTPEQAAALVPIAKAVRERASETFLLHGVTGSGKTEVYLRAVAEALAQDRQALVLVPEITLTHQILARLRGRFGDNLAVLHSGLSPGERLEQWQRLRGGATPIAVGARSALFAPLENLGVIVIDEEHDTAYKNDEGFRYRARDLAALRAREAGCPVILGSATPAVETRYAADRGDVTRLTLSYRVGDRPLPAVEVVDLARERDLAPRGRKLILSRKLRGAMQETLDLGGQTILFLNRRGFSTQILCFDCGFAERCVNCDIALVYHAAEQTLRCHYCDHQLDPPDTCRGCGAPDTALLGVGTQRLEEEVRSEFPTARIARMDRDNARKRGFVAGVLDDLGKGRLDVLIGTQMVAKGHDFPGVRLVGVIAADIGLHMPDFRAAERTFQLLTQVAGRAGRGVTPGRAILQTFVPKHYAVAPVSQHDYEGFYAEEVGYRRALGYPPFGRLVHVLVSAEEEKAAADGVQALADAVARAGIPKAGACDLLGPSPSPLAKLRGRYRYQLLVKGSDAARVRAAAEFLCEAGARLPEGITAAVDANPTNML